MTRGEIALAAGLGLAFAVGLVEVSQYRWQVALGPGLACGLGLALMAALMVQARRGTALEVSVPAFTLAEAGQFGWLVLAISSVTALGFAVGGGAYVLLHVLATRSGRHRLAVALVCGAMVPLVVYGVFEALLEIRLFPGLLFG